MSENTVKGISVIEVVDNNCMSVHTFKMTATGRKAAKEFFDECIKENNDNEFISDDEFKTAFDIGEWADGHGYFIYLKKNML